MILDYLSKLLLTETRLAELGYRKETQEDRDAQLPVIEFICEPKHMLVMPPPEMAGKNIAAWWKRIKTTPEGVSTTNPPRDHMGGVSMTAKHCLPLFDGMSLGYTMVTPVDINVRTRHDGGEIHITSGPTFNGASTHDTFQFGGQKAPGYPMHAIKFHNPWMIKTRPGYSVLFLPMLNWLDEDEDRFTCFAAAVDTDVYPKQINFPGLFHKKGYDGIIKAGTPLVTAIPYKRSDVPRELIIRTLTAAERHLISRFERTQNSRSGMYTKELREDRKSEHLTKPVGCPFHNPEQFEGMSPAGIADEMEARQIEVNTDNRGRVTGIVTHDKLPNIGYEQPSFVQNAMIESAPRAEGESK